MVTPKRNATQILTCNATPQYFARGLFVVARIKEIPEVIHTQRFNGSEIDVESAVRDCAGQGEKHMVEYEVVHRGNKPSNYGIVKLVRIWSVVRIRSDVDVHTIRDGSRGVQKENVTRVSHG
jgi:hypothetical protein